MTTDTVFAASATTEVTPVVTTTPSTTLPPEVSEFVGTGKKYSSVEDALKSVPHAQKHISTLEVELAQVKEELTKRRTTEELLAEIKSSGIPNVDTTTKPGVTPDQIEQLVNQSLAQKEIQNKAKDNVNKVTSAFTEKYGEKAEEIYIKIAKESGLTIKDLNNLAATSPSAVLILAGLDPKRDTSVPAKVTGSVNTESMRPNSDPTALSARVGNKGSTKALVDAWKIAGQKIGKTT